MPVHGTTLKSLYNRPNDNGKATDIQDEDLVYLQRGDGSDRDKAIKGSDLKISNGKVLADSEDTVPKTLYGKLLDSPTISFQKTTQGSAPGNRYVTAGVKDSSIDTQHIKDSAVESAKIKDRAVTTQKIQDGGVSTAKLQNASVSGAKLGASLINSQYSVNLLIGTDIDQSTNTFASKIHTFSAVDYGGIIDVSVYALGVNITYMDNVKFQIRKTGSSTAETEWDVDKLLETELSRRLLVKNGVNSPATYELWVIGDVTGAMPSGLSGFLACEVDIRGISLA